MSLISSNIPNLINGVSQQPPSLRLGSQAEEQINGLSDVVTGLTKRPPTEHLGTIIGDLSTSKIHTYKRDENEQYTVMVSDGAIRVLNQDGVELDVELDVDDEGVPYTYDYISGINAEQDIRITSIADFSFILNTKKVVLKSDEILPKSRTPEALVYLKQVDFDKRYTVNVIPTSDGSVDYNTATSTSITNSSTSGQELQTDTVVGALRDGLGDNSGGVETFSARQGTLDTILEYTLQSSTISAYVADPSSLSITVGATLISPTVYTIDTSTNKLKISAFGGVFKPTGKSNPPWKIDELIIYLETFTGLDSSFVTYPRGVQAPFFIIANESLDFNVRVADDSGGTSLKAFKNTAKSFTDLPNQCLDGFRLSVIGDNNKDEDNFHVVFEGDYGQGVWQETVKAGIQNKFDLTTMPHRLEKFISDGTDGRVVGEVFWKFGPTPFLERSAGDEDTNPFPSFVGNTINDIFFHRNRLGFLSDENVIFSEASGFYNFFRTTVRALLDSAPIDVAVSNDSVSILKAAIPYCRAALIVL